MRAEYSIGGRRGDVQPVLNATEFTDVSITKPWSTTRGLQTERSLSVHPGKGIAWVERFEVFIGYFSVF